MGHKLSKPAEEKLNAREYDPDNSVCSSHLTDCPSYLHTM